MSDGTETNYAPDAMSEMTEDDRPPPGSSEDEDDESLNEHVAENQLRYSSSGDEEERESGDDDEGGAGSDNADEEEFDDDELDERALEEDVNYIDRNGGRQSLEEEETAAALVEAIIDQENNRTATAGQPTSVLTSNVALGSLLKYDTPVSVSKAAFTTDDVVFSTPPTLAAIHGAADEPGGRLSATPGTSSLSAVEQLLSQVAGSSSSSTTVGSGSAAAAKKGMQQVIDMILPPIVWEQDGQLWMQQVSSKPATRLDVLNLQRLLDMRLEHRQAKETGICPIRRELYTQAFDELIRQVTVNCAERGLLLLRVRDELKMTLSAYQTLFESSCAFGIRKTLQAREGREELERRVESLEKEKQALLEECDRLRGQLDDAKRLHEEQRAVEANTHKEKVEFYQHKVQQIKNQLEAILAAKK